jgi:hypothetical protein
MMPCHPANSPFFVWQSLSVWCLGLFSFADPLGQAALIPTALQFAMFFSPSASTGSGERDH